MRKNLIKGLALGMAVCMSVVGCGTNSSSSDAGTTTGGKEEQSTAGTTAGAEDETTTEGEESMYPAYDFGGQTFTLLAQNDLGGKDPASVADDPTSDEDDYQREQKQQWLDYIEDKYNCDLVFVPAPQAEWNEVAQEIVNAYTAGQPLADIMDLYYNYLAPLTNNNVLLDMTDYFKGDDTYKTNHILTFLGKDLGIGSTIAGEGLYYNKEMINDAGMENTPAEMFAMGKWDYENCLEYLRKLQANLGEGQYALFVDGTYWTLFGSTANGVKLLKDNGELCYIDDEFIETMEFMQTCIREGICINYVEAGISTWTYPSENFGTNIAIAHRAAWQAAGSAGSFELGFVPYPWGSGVSIDEDKIGEMDAYKTLEGYMQTYFDGQVMTFTKGVEKKADPMQLTSMMCELMGWDSMRNDYVNPEGGNGGAGWLEDDTIDDELYIWSRSTEVWNSYNTVKRLWTREMSFGEVLCNTSVGPRAALEAAYNFEMYGVVEAGLADKSWLEGLDPLPSTSETAAE